MKTGEIHETCKLHYLNMFVIADLSCLLQILFLFKWKKENATVTDLSLSNNEKKINAERMIFHVLGTQ